MKKKFLKNLFLLIILNLLVKPFWIFAVDRSVQNQVGAGEYGFYFSLLSFSMLFNILLDLGITNFNNRSISRNASFLKDHLLNIVSAKFILAFLYAAVSLGLALTLGYDKRQLMLLLVIILNQFLSSFVLYLRSNISGLQYFTTDSLLSVLDRMIMIVLCSLLLWGHFFSTSLKITWFVYAQTISYAAAALVCGIVLMVKTREVVLTFNWSNMAGIIRQIAPFALLGLFMSIYNRTDSVLIERLLPDGKVQAGIYAQSFRILDAFSNFSLLFASLLLPMFSRMLATKEDFVPLLKTSFSLLFIMCTALTLPCIAFNKEIITALYREGGEYSAQVFAVLILSFIPISLSYIFGTLLTANGNLKLLNYASATAMVVNIVLNLLFIRHYKILGAAVANIVTQTLMVVIEIVICFRLWKFRASRNNMLKYSLFVVLSMVTVYVCYLMTGAWIVRFLSAMVVIGMLSLVTRIFSFGHYFTLLLSKLER